jgi:hypothetical protein
VREILVALTRWGVERLQSESLSFELLLGYAPNVLRLSHLDVDASSTGVGLTSHHTNSPARIRA